jgi:hypothetical protein
VLQYGLQPPTVAGTSTVQNTRSGETVYKMTQRAGASQSILDSRGERCDSILFLVLVFQCIVLSTGGFVFCWGKKQTGGN